MLHLICSNVREHQKGKFIVLVTERDIVGASCYLKMINKNSYWFCKVNNSSCSSAGVGQWQGLAELLGTIHPPMGSQLYTSLHLQCIAFQLQLHCSAWCKDSPGAVTNLLQSCRLGWLNAAPERGGHRKEGKGCFKNQTLQSLHFLGFLFPALCTEMFLTLSALVLGQKVLRDQHGPPPSHCKGWTVVNHSFHHLSSCCWAELQEPQLCPTELHTGGQGRLLHSSPSAISLGLFLILLKRPKISQYMAMESGKLRLISTLPLLFIFSARPDVMVLISLREMGKNEDASLSFKYIILAVLFLHFPSKLWRSLASFATNIHYGFVDSIVISTFW